MIECAGLTRRYPNGVTALDGVGFSVPAGGYAAVIGSSGSGKSTLLNVLGLLDRPDAGTYRLEGIDTGRLSDRALSGLRARMLGFVFQSFDLVPRMTALENVELGLILSGAPSRGRREAAAESLAAVGLADRMDHLPAQLSGGQQQRVAVARAVARSPRLLLADEPTGNLDPAAAAGIIGLLEAQNRLGVTVLLITHAEEVARRAGTVFRMEAGRLSPVDPLRLKGRDAYEKRQDQLLS